MAKEVNYSVFESGFIYVNSLIRTSFDVVRSRGEQADNWQEVMRGFSAISVLRLQEFCKGRFMEKLENFFIQYSGSLGGIGLGVALNSMGLSWIPVLGFVVAFTSVHSVLMEILRALAANKRFE